MGSLNSETFFPDLQYPVRHGIIAEDFSQNLQIKFELFFDVIRCYNRFCLKIVLQAHTFFSGSILQLRVPIAHCISRRILFYFFKEVVCVLSNVAGPKL